MTPCALHNCIYFLIIPKWTDKLYYNKLYYEFHLECQIHTGHKVFIITVIKFVKTSIHYNWRILFQVGGS